MSTPRAALLMALALALGEAALQLAYRLSPAARRALFLPGLPGDAYATAGDLRELLDMAEWRLRPGGRFYGEVLDEHGFRTPGVSPEREAGRRRVLLLGDSFLVDGLGVAPGEHLARLLAARLGGARAAEVVNLGVVGTGPAFYRRLMELHGARLAPDVTVVALFVGNDILDSVPDAGIQRLLQRRIMTLRLLRNAARLAAGVERSPRPYWPPAGVADRGPAPAPSAGTLSPEAHARVLEERGVMFREPWQDEVSRGWARASADLLAIRDAARAAGGDILLALLPDETQVEPGAAPAPGPDGRASDLPQRVIAAWARERGIAVADLLPAFRAARERGGPLFKAHDTHWTPRGHAAAAEALAAAVGGLPGAAGGRP